MDDSQISLFANFDSANMARYERVWKSSSQNSPNSSTNAQSPSNNSKTNSNDDKSDQPERQPQPSLKFDCEFNVWTKPDCEDTEHGANPNRTWFYFGVKGGHGKYIKFNMMNLNKQGKLFEMGMLPVFRTVPGHEKWARIYTRPTWQNNDTNFMMSFIHRIPDKRDTITYFAFCFPHSYEECQQMLEKCDQKFDHCKNLIPERTEPDDIYYHREVLCYSLDQRRIDLITVSACNLLNYKREPRFDPDYLFPRQSKNGESENPDDQYITERRSYSFEKKKVFVLTSRVHPGETPASFVFNGFFEFILKKDDPRARVLRRQFVFKLVPMLNPDGVARGYYRTDQLGTNLNRVYLDPCFKFHPSIYAIKSLIVYHHINNRISKEHDGLNFDHVFRLEYDDDPILANQNTNEDSGEFGIYTSNIKSSGSDELNRTTGVAYTSATSSSFSPVVDSANNLDEVNVHKSSKVKLSRIPKNKSIEKISPDYTVIPKKTFTSNNNLVVDCEKSKLSMFSHLSKPDSIGESFSRNKALAERLTSEWMNNEYYEELKTNETKSKTESSPTIFDTIDYDKKGNDIDSDDECNNDEPRIGNENSDDDDPNQPDYMLFSGAKNSPHLNDPKLALINPLWSGVAFYVDLHGHAAKRGCFIYGNSIDNELYQVENVLFAKLISISSQHFDFDGCNFSVRNMYMKDKREGLSKEGSGRVAMFKTLGLIHSYTLECCYASGRVMNTIVPAINTVSSRLSAISPPLHSDIPPKFMPEHYADVGKAVAIAALDIIEMNPNTRIPNTSFGSLEAIRNWLKFYIRSKAERGSTAVSSNINSFNNMIPMPVGSNQSNANNIKKTNQRFYFQQKLNKLAVNPSKSLNSTAAAASTSSTTDTVTNKSQDVQQQSISTKSTTSINVQNKTKTVNILKKSIITQASDDAISSRKSLPQSTSQGNLVGMEKFKITDSSSQTPVKTSSIGLVDFSNNLLNNPAQVGTSQFSSTRTKMRHSIKQIRDLEATGNNIKRLNSNNSPTNISSGSTSSNLQATSSQKPNNETLTTQLRRKLSLKTEPIKVSEIENILESDYYLNGALNKLTSKDKRWYLSKDNDTIKDDISNILTPTNDEFTYQTPEDLSAKLSNHSKSNFKHLIPINKPNKLSSNSINLLTNNNNNDLNSNVVFFKQLHSSLLAKPSSPKGVPMNLANTSSIVSSLRPDNSFKNIESTSIQHKKFLNAMKPKSGKSSHMDFGNLSHKRSVLETTNLFDLNEAIKNGTFELDFEGNDTRKLNKPTFNYQIVDNESNLIFSKKQQKYLKNQEISNILSKVKKKK